MRLLAKLAVIGALAVTPLSMAGTAFASTSAQTNCPSWQSNCVTDHPTGFPTGNPTWKPTDKPTDYPTFKPTGDPGNQGNSWDNKGPKCDPSPIRLGGPDLRRDFTPTGNCLPKPDPRPLPKPDPRPVFPRTPTCHDVTTWTHGGFRAVEMRRTTKDCAPQDNNWNYKPQQKDWYDPTAGGWYAPVTGWTGGYQNDKGFWCYPKHQIVPLTSWNDHRGNDPKGNCNCGNQGNHQGNRCYPQNVIFELPTYGDWLLETSGPSLHNGEVLTYNGQTWTVGDWTTPPNPHATGSQGIGDYFTLTSGGHTLQGHGIVTEVAHTVCNTAR